MILDLVLLVFQGLLNILLLPFTIINITIDLVSGIPLIVQFLQVVAYILPWSNILPLILLVIAIFVFRIAVAVYFFIKNSIQWW